MSSRPPQSAPPLDAHRIQRALASCAIGGEATFHEEIPSTNSVAAQLAAAGHPHGCAVFAESQTAGRGRRGATWVAPSRANVLVSFILRPPLPLEQWPRLTALAGLSVATAITETTEIPAQIKWPNDIYIGGHKAAGILLEARWEPTPNASAILGIGINVNMTTGDFPADLDVPATSLAAARGQEISRESVAIALCRALARELPAAEKDAVFAEKLIAITARSFLEGKPITASEGGHVLRGIARGLGPNGELRLLLPDGSSRLVANAENIRVDPSPKS